MKTPWSVFWFTDIANVIFFYVRKRSLVFTTCFEAIVANTGFLRDPLEHPFSENLSTTSSLFLFADIQTCGSLWSMANFLLISDSDPNWEIEDNSISRWKISKYERSSQMVCLHASFLVVYLPKLLWMKLSKIVKNWPILIFIFYEGNSLEFRFNHAYISILEENTR